MISLLIRQTNLHHKLTAFEYADGVNKVTGYDLTDLDMYYAKLEMHIILVRAVRIEISILSIQQILMDLQSKDQNGKLLVHLHQIQSQFLLLKQVLVEHQTIRYSNNCN